MKVPPKRKGNTASSSLKPTRPSLNESPSEKEGKYRNGGEVVDGQGSLNESPSEKEGKSEPLLDEGGMSDPSMKVPPKRKGNPVVSATA